MRFHLFLESMNRHTLTSMSPVTIPMQLLTVAATVATRHALPTILTPIPFQRDATFCAEVPFRTKNAASVFQNLSIIWIIRNAVVLRNDVEPKNGLGHVLDLFTAFGGALELIPAYCKGVASRVQIALKGGSLKQLLCVE